MQIRSKTYLHMISRLRALRSLMPPHEEPISQEASPSLMFISIVLAFLLAMLEIDLHSVELQALGLSGGAFPVDPVFKMP
jgi:hypothetical protein